MGKIFEGIDWKTVAAAVVVVFLVGVVMRGVAKVAA